MLKKFDHEIWTADGPEVAVVGFQYPTRMAIIRLSDRALFIWSHSVSGAHPVTE